VKIDLIVIGRLKAGPERDLATRYANRFKAISRRLGLDGPNQIDLHESLARRDTDRRDEEAAAILAHLPHHHALILFDETGEAMESKRFAQQIEAWRDDAQAGISLVIGGADGLAKDLLPKAKLVLAFGKMTIPHQLVRILVLEQLYRAATILSNHPYHRGG
jgi:23S rRNA (pseudouridine1915-N3)-methyltransferase